MFSLPTCPCAFTLQLQSASSSSSKLCMQSVLMLAFLAFSLEKKLFYWNPQFEKFRGACAHFLFGVFSEVKKDLKNSDAYVPRMFPLAWRFLYEKSFKFDISLFYFCYYNFLDKLLLKISFHSFCDFKIVLLILFWFLNQIGELIIDFFLLKTASNTNRVKKG